MSATSESPMPLPEVCPACGGSLFLAPFDPMVPSYPVYSDIIPIVEQRCGTCGQTWVGEAGVLVRTVTALARARHELRRLRREQRGEAD